MAEFHGHPRVHDRIRRYRTPKGFRTVGKIKQPLDTFRMPVDLRIDTEGNPEQKTVD